MATPAERERLRDAMEAKYKALDAPADAQRALLEPRLAAAVAQQDSFRRTAFHWALGGGTLSKT